MIRLWNTKTRRKEDFVPLDRSNVRMYVCGPTVYDRAHLGNARPVVVFDVLYRLLRHSYGADAVTYVRNFTDVDDKINARASEMAAAGDARPLEAIIRGLTDTTIDWFHQDMDALGALRPTHAPRATEWIGPMVAMIGTLIDRGHAYAVQGHVLFRVRSYAAYGALSGRSVDDMIAGARVEVAPYKEDPLDFVLWKPSTPEQPGWDSPWGRGRPGWHIECSAMARELLGESFDIHAGGIDLQFPHHENEIAQSACAHDHGEFAKVWLHNEMLQVEGKKMSKSLGNFFTVRDLLDKGVPGEVIRYVMLMTHYRSPMDWTEAKRREARKALDWLYSKVGEVELDERLKPGEGVVSALADDLNTSLALTALQRQAETILPSQLPDAEGSHELEAVELKRTANLLGLLQMKESEWVELTSVGTQLEPLAQKLATLRSQAVSTKDFSALDAYKAVLLAAGLEVRMPRTGIQLVPGPDFDPAKLEFLL